MTWLAYGWKEIIWSGIKSLAKSRVDGRVVKAELTKGGRREEGREWKGKGKVEKRERQRERGKK